MFPLSMSPDQESNSAQDSRRQLNEAIESLYATFAFPRRFGPVTGCHHCTSPDDDERLRSKPLRQLSGEDLKRFALKAMTTLGSVEDFKHFVPRLFEIAAFEGNVGYMDFEIVMGKLRYGEWARWPEIEQAAIKQYLNSLWEHKLSVFPCLPDVDSCLCGIGQAVDDLRPFLNAWQSKTSLPALRHLADFIEDNLRTMVDHQSLGNAFWPNAGQQMRQVAEWLLEPRLAAHLEKGFFACSVDPVATELAQAVDRLGWMRIAVGKAVDVSGNSQ